MGYEQALQLAMTEKDTCAMMSCYTSQGVYLRSSGKLTEAIAAYDKALQYAPLLSGNNEDNLQTITTLYNNLATVYLDMKNPAQAVKYALDAVKQADKDKSFRTQIYTVCSSIFITQEEYEAAKTYLSKAIALSQQLQQPETELGARTYYLLTLFRTQASASEIQKLVEQTNALAAKVNSTMVLVNYYQVLFYVQQTRKEWKAATQTAQKILQLPRASKIIRSCNMTCITTFILSTRNYLTFHRPTTRWNWPRHSAIRCSCKKKVASWKSFP